MLRAVGQGLHAFRQDGTFLDFTIEVDDQEFKVHKVVMASVSDYFKVMLTGGTGMVESQADRVRLEGLDVQAVSAMLEFIYTGEFGSTEASAEDLLACAIYLQIQSALDVCRQLLCDQVNAKNCIDILETFKAYYMDEGVEQTLSFIVSNMDEILKGLELNRMALDKLEIIVDCWQKSDWKLFLIIKEWIEFDSQNHTQHLNDLMSRVRFALMTPEQLEAVRVIDIYSESDGSWCNLLAEAQKYHNLPTHLKVLDVSEQSKVRTDPVPLFSEDNSNDIFYVLEGAAWVQHHALNPTEGGFTVNASTVVNNFFIACKEQELYVFDPRNKKWSFMTQMAVAKRQFRLVHCDKQLYIVGGKTKVPTRGFVATDTIEQYDFETDNWSALPSTMPVKLEDFNACALNGSIYIIGGWERTPGIRNIGDFSTRMDCFDPTTGTWTSKAPITEITDYTLEVMELFKEEVIVIMTYGFLMHYYSPTTDQWSEYNPLMGATTRLVYHWRGGVLPTTNTLFLINFSYSEHEYVPGRHRLDLCDTTPGGCEVWTMGEKGKKPIVKKLDDFPATGVDDSYFVTVLAVAPQ